MADPVASVIIPCKGPPEPLARLLVDLAAQRIAAPFEIIVVDAWSNEAIARLARDTGARLVRGTRALPGTARNLGAQAAQSPVLAFIDADCRADRGWLAAALAALGQGARIAAGPVVDLHPHHPIARADNLLQFADLPRTRPAGPMHMAPSCNMAVTADDFRALGGFRHREGLSTGEDVDFCQRATTRWPEGIHFAPAMAVRHAGRHTLAAMMAHHRAFGYSRGRLRLLLTDRQARLGRRVVLAPAVALRRLSYISGRVLRLSPRKLPATIALSPLLLIGALAWTGGFRSGLIDSEPEPPTPSEA